MRDYEFISMGSLRTCPYAKNPQVVEVDFSDPSNPKTDCILSKDCDASPCPLVENLKQY